MPNATSQRPLGHASRYRAAGLLVIAPLWVTYLVFDFLLGALSRTGRPGVSADAARLDGRGRDALTVTSGASAPDTVPFYPPRPGPAADPVC